MVKNHKKKKIKTEDMLFQIEKDCRHCPAETDENGLTIKHSTGRFRI